MRDFYGQPAFRRLLVWLKANDGSGYGCIELNTNEDIVTFVEQLREASGREVAEINYSPQYSGSDMGLILKGQQYRTMENFRKKYGEKAILVMTNLSETVDHSSEKEIKALVQEINMNRENYVNYPSQVLFVFPVWFMDRIYQGAYDFKSMIGFHANLVSSDNTDIFSKETPLPTLRLMPKKNLMATYRDDFYNEKMRINERMRAGRDYIDVCTYFYIQDAEAVETIQKILEMLDILADRNETIAVINEEVIQFLSTNPSLRKHFSAWLKAQKKLKKEKENRKMEPLEVYRSMYTAYKAQGSSDEELACLERILDLLAVDADGEKQEIEEAFRKLFDSSKFSLEQKRILQLFTIFTPEKVIYYKIQQWADLDIEAMDGLIQLGWIVRMSTGFLIHQVISDSLKRMDNGEVKIEEYGELLDKVIDTKSYMPEDLVYTVIQERLVMAEDVARHLEKRVKGLVEAGECLEKAGELLINLSILFNNLAGVVYSKQGDYEKALEYYGKDIDIKERVFGTEHPVTATLYNDIGMVYKYQGNYEKALKYYEKALAIREQVLGTQHPTTAITYNNLAAVYEDQGYYEKAQEYYEKALAIYEKVRGTEHPNIAIMYNNLAGVNYYLGDYEKALEYYGKALVIYEQVHGTEDSTTANMYNNLAGVYKDQGDYEKALEYFGKALAIREQVLGTEHPSTAATYNNLALVYIDQGDYEKALEYFGKALAICEQVLGTDHPTTATTYNNLTGVYIAQGDYKKALDCLGKALAIDERVFGFDHPATASTYNNLAVVYAHQGNYEKALEYCGKTLAIIEQVLGTEHPSTATTYNNIAWIYCKLGDYVKALVYYEKALRIRLEKLGANHPHTQDTQRWIEWVRTHIKSEK